MNTATSAKPTNPATTAGDHHRHPQRRDLGPETAMGPDDSAVGDRQTPFPPRRSAPRRSLQQQTGRLATDHRTDRPGTLILGRSTGPFPSPAGPLPLER